MNVTAPDDGDRLRARIRELETERDSVAKFQVMVDLAPMAIITVDSRRTIKHVNRNAAVMFGYETAELLGQNLEILIPERMREGHAEMSARYLQKPEAREMGKGRYLNGRRKDASLIPVEIALSPIDLAGEKHVMALIADITLRRKWEQEHEEMLRRITETQKLESIGLLAGGVAHDFNNILTGIMLNASLLGEILPGEGEHRELIAGIMESGARAADLCRQLLAYAGKGRIVTEQRDLSQLVHSSTKLIQATVRKSARVRFDLANPGPSVCMDATQMSQVVMNLVLNASEACEGEAAEISLRTGLLSVDKDWLAQAIEGGQLPPGTYAMLSVADNGAGISPQDRKRIFEPFFTTKFQGRGLGLSAVLGIVRGHGGALRLDSEPGRGTEFVILLPLSQEALALARQTQAADAPQRPRILVIDDDETILKSAAWALHRSGYECDTSRDGHEGLSLFGADHQRYRLILLDLTMPRMDGLETCRRLRQISPSIPILLMSGYGNESMQKGMLEAEFSGFLAKPFDSESLVSLVRHHLVQPEADPV